MARYVVSVRTPMPPKKAFSYMADLTNFAEWDPGVTKSVQAVGTSPALDSAYDVTVKGFAGPMTLRYVITGFDSPSSVVARAESKLLTSLDRISVEPHDEGSIVTYDAELTLNGVAGLADPVLGLAFKRIGDKAAAGMIRVLDGERYEKA